MSDVEYTLLDPEGITHVNANLTGTMTTWCEYKELRGNGIYWSTYELKLSEDVPTCLRCVGAR